MDMLPTVAIVDDDPELRAIIRHYVTRSAACVIGEATDGRQGLALVEREQPDIVVTDVVMPKLNGIEFASQVRGRFPKTRVIVLSAYAHYAMRAITAGVKGYLLKPIIPHEFSAAMHAVSNGGSYITSAVSNEVVARGDGRAIDELACLSSRHREILQLIAEGYSCKEIARELQIETSTARRHREELMRRLGFHNVVHLVHFAIRTGIIRVNIGKAS